MPPPFVNTGNPMRPRKVYTIIDMGANLGPNRIPDKATNIHCNVKGTIGEGMVIFEPIVIRATKRAISVISFALYFKIKILLPFINT